MCEHLNCKKLSYDEWQCQNCNIILPLKECQKIITENCKKCQNGVFHIFFENAIHCSCILDETLNGKDGFPF